MVINGEKKDVSGISLEEFLTKEGYNMDRVVVELNLEIVPKEKLGEIIIQENDSIEVLNFVSGG
ncbi:MAG: sulfur carrier protein ThiS [Lachnospiraceae bacterium]|nr:sulfur carrier protein ThiS [Lachnospiraceae bacterium]